MNDWQWKIEAEIQQIVNLLEDLTTRIEKLEACSHEPYDLDDLIERLDNLERHVHGSDPMEE